MLLIVFACLFKTRLGYVRVNDCPVGLEIRIHGIEPPLARNRRNHVKLRKMGITLIRSKSFYKTGYI